MKRADLAQNWLILCPEKVAYRALSCLMFMGKMSGTDPSNAMLVSFWAVASVGWYKSQKTWVILLAQ